MGYTEELRILTYIGVLAVRQRAAALSQKHCIHEDKLWRRLTVLLLVPCRWVRLLLYDTSAPYPYLGGCCEVRICVNSATPSDAPLRMKWMAIFWGAFTGLGSIR